MDRGPSPGRGVCRCEVQRDDAQDDYQDGDPRVPACLFSDGQNPRRWGGPQVFSSQGSLSEALGALRRSAGERDPLSVLGGIRRQVYGPDPAPVRLRDRGARIVRGGLQCGLAWSRGRSGVGVIRVRACWSMLACCRDPASGPRWRGSGSGGLRRRMGVLRHPACRGAADAACVQIQSGARA